MVSCLPSNTASVYHLLTQHQVGTLAAQPLDESISLKFSLENRLESKSFEPLIDFLAFMVQKL